jgi:hypothetical protein
MFRLITITITIADSNQYEDMTDEPVTQNEIVCQRNFENQTELELKIAPLRGA